MNPITIVLADDQVLFREGLHTLLSAHPGFIVAGEASNGEEAIQMALTHHPDVILMDLRMPVMDGVNATRRIHTLLPECRVIVLTTFDDDESVFDGLRAGAVGYLLKDVPSNRLFEAIQATARGESFLQPSITAKVIAEFSRMANQSPSHPQPLVEPLSERELEILRQVATGASNKEIAANFVIAEGTVKNHITNILRKLEVQDRTQAVLRARDLRII
jgi:DNA-binding NarL/FixJ family response regulator